MEEISPAVSLPFPETQMEFAGIMGIMLRKGYCYSQYSTQDSHSVDSFPYTSCSVSGSHVAQYRERSTFQKKMISEQRAGVCLTSRLILRSPTNSLIHGRFNPQSTAHFFGVYNSPGGSQVTNYCRERKS
ncbi:hypothetical protein YC2023_002656 [Brassica napus]